MVHSWGQPYFGYFSWIARIPLYLARHFPRAPPVSKSVGEDSVWEDSRDKGEDSSCKMRLLEVDFKDISESVQCGSRLKHWKEWGMSSRLWRVYLHDQSSSRKPRLPHTIFVNGFWHKLKLVTFHSKITTHRNYLWSWLDSHLKNARNVISHWRKLDSHQFMYSAPRDCIPFDHLSSWYVNSQPLCFSARI